MWTSYRYCIGRWYLIARIPNLFDLNMKRVSAEYSLNEDGTITVINKGYSNGKLKEVIGVAKTTDKDDLLKVSFIPNVYSDYKILGIDKNYQYAVVGGSNNDFLWILARTKNIFQYQYDWLVSVAKKNGYNVDKLK
jgi:apolipoprotein D and lipocalin family protein